MNFSTEKISSDGGALLFPEKKARNNGIAGKPIELIITQRATRKARRFTKKDPLRTSVYPLRNSAKLLLKYIQRLFRAGVRRSAVGSQSLTTNH